MYPTLIAKRVLFLQNKRLWVTQLYKKALMEMEVDLPPCGLEVKATIPMGGMRVYQNGALLTACS